MATVKSRTSWINLVRFLIRFFISLTILPLCWAFGKISFVIISALPTFAICLLSGIIIAIFTVISKGYIGRLDIFLHELNHVLWSSIAGIEVKGFSSNSRGGHVEVERMNLFAALAPYFFPIPLCLLSILHILLHLTGLNIKYYLFVEYFVAGFFYARHIIITFQILRLGQSDTRSTGLMLSSCVICTLFCFWSSLFIIIIAPNFYLADFLRLSYKEISSGYFFCYKLFLNSYEFVVNHV